MGLGVSILLIATGAALAWAVELPNEEAINLNALGTILMVTGLIGLLAVLALWNNWIPDRRRRPDNEEIDLRPRTVADEAPLVERRRIVEEPPAGHSAAPRTVTREDTVMRRDAL